ncbi:MAG TPA: chromosome segregation protein SMC, partial [Hyphomonas sp.]|nr:chromosome segregation protein SMC [Hyphomonas sp.]
EHARNAFQRTPEGLLAIAEAGLDEEEMGAFSPREAEAKLDGLRREREHLGGVNMNAEEEAAELETRLGVQIAEKDDLVAAISRLREGVEALNVEARSRLLEAFEAVNTHFKALFEALFGGGQAELRLVDADDPLNAGLEIFAQPPGKKLGTLALMSGGEQALTASALIFAVFLSRPAPICVLDEVDAPLDDANVDRFCNMLNEMRQRTDTRFVIITHNPVTMSRMDRLFGVTMREKGVSKLVSVDLAGAEQLVAAE